MDYTFARPVQIGEPKPKITYQWKIDSWSSCSVTCGKGIQILAIFIRDGPLENLLEGGGGGRSTKKIFAQGKIKRKKIHARQLTLRNIHVMAYKNSYKEFDNEEKFLQLENSPRPPCKTGIEYLPVQTR